jgi:hypothetical protein
MRQYYTLIQAFTPEYRSLAEYLDSQGIEYTLGADFAQELKEFGYINPSKTSNDLVKKYTVLIDEHELSAIKLSVDGVSIIQNRASVNTLNTARKYFKWFLT